MINYIKLHLHPLGGRIIFWNFILLILVKLIIPHSAFQTASLLGIIPTFDSSQIIIETNRARLNNNLLELKEDSKLNIAASQKLEDMAINEYFAHTSPSGVSPWYWIKNTGYQYSIAGENLAIGFITADDTVQAWLNSPSHKANLLNTKYKDIGVAVKSVEINGREGILVVQIFGAQSNQIAATNIVPTPTPVLALNTSLSNSVAAPQTRGESVALSQEISTDPVIESSEEPIPVKFPGADRITKNYNLINNIYSIYVLVIAIISMIAFFTFYRNRDMAFKMSLNFGLLILAVVIPASSFILDGLIF